MSPEYQQIVDDARLVIRYGMNSGRLPEAGAMANAVAAIENIPADKPIPPDLIVHLIDLMSAAIKAIAPITLMDLRAGRDPLAPKNRRKLVVMQGVFSALCIVLTTAIAAGSFLLHQKTAALNYVVETEAANPREQYAKAWQFYRSNNIGGDQPKVPGIGGDQPKVPGAVFEQQINQLHAVFEQQINQLQKVDRKLRDAVAIVGPALNRGSWLFCRFGMSGSSCNSLDTAGGTPVASENKMQPEALMNADSWQAECNQKPVDCENKIRALITQSDSTGNNDQWKELNLFPQYGLLFTSVTVPDFSLHQLTLTAEIIILNTWLLPFLYGLLGASVFCTRSFMDMATANAGLWSALSRVFMGGVAGIVIGWVWGAVPMKGTELLPLAGSPVLAFVAGFGIEILFSVLDRINKAALGLIQKTPATT